ncbi:hypothetical protein C8Q78DRAFT_1071184 [Trametes maxima]|nr:hypothetical protein C8Q78DRAFT_1071184 [Trametes maxima]
MPSYTEDSASDSSFEDGNQAQSVPLLPFQSWSPSALKETFSSPTTPAWPARLPLPPVVRRRCVLLTITLLGILGGVPLLLSSRLNSVELERVPPSAPHKADINPPAPPAVTLPPVVVEEVVSVEGDALPVHLRPDTYLEGLSATAHFRDSLRNDTGYMTSFLSAGWTNDQITMGNLIYLSMITGRIPIIPPFTSHINEQASPLPYSDIFDVPRMVLALNTPILEWHMIKDLEHLQTPDARDELGCWNIWEVDNMQSTGPRGSYSTELLNLDISYTRAPANVKLIPNFEHDSHSTFWSLAKLAFPDGRAEALERPNENPTRPSSNGLVCYDYLYYVCALDPFEFERDYSPMWREVMVHAHWNAVPQRLAEEYLRHTFHLPDGAPIPPFIVIHARRGDFLGWCGDVPKDDCFAPLSAFARRVREVQEEVRRRHGVYVPASRVVMTGDEKDARWWAAVEERGWRRLNHAGERTAERFGNWYPVILDAVVQSMAIGFVGTDRSTFSHMARRRVTDWNNGAVRLVKWGTIGADDH